jgi:DNA-binding LacI/PurR family transcriptional regulator
VLHELQPEDMDAAVARLLRLTSGERPTAIVTSNDRLALGVLMSLEERGIAVGSGVGQIAVTGFDDLPVAAFLRPPLTTVRQPLEAACEMLLNLLIARMRNRDVETPNAGEQDINRVGPDQFLLEPELVIRGSA